MIPRSPQIRQAAGNLHGNPHDADDNVHSLSLSAFPFVAPHAVFLIIPERSTRAVHPSPTNLLRSSVLDFAVLRGSRRPRVGQMLNYCAVDGELVLRAGLLAGQRRRRLRDKGFEDGIDDGVVPALRLAVFVEGRGRERGFACIGADLSEACGGDGLRIERVSVLRLWARICAETYRIRCCHFGQGVVCLSE